MMRSGGGVLSLLVFGAAAMAGGDGRALLIVVPEALREAVGEYAAARAGALPTEICVLETILGGTPGADDPERLKRFLYARWHDPGAAPPLGYVLLVGDADVMPVRYTVLDRWTPAAANYAFYPSDLYYADLAGPDGAFDDWNGALADEPGSFHAGYYGEVRGETNKADPINFDAIDYRPDIAVGRWPVSTAEEVRTVAAKSRAYVEWIAAGAPARVGLVATGGWIENRGAMDAIGASLAGWAVDKRYYTDGAQDDKTPPPDEAQVVGLLDTGTPMIFHSGHGNDDRWDGSITVAGLANLRNAEHPAVMFSAGCSTARLATLPPYEAYTDISGVDHAGTNFGETFDTPPPPPAPYQRGAFNPTGLGEQLLRFGPAGAAAYIGCNTGGQPCGMALMEGFAAAVGAPKDPSWRLGDCWSAAVAAYYDSQGLATIVPNEDWYPASIFFQGMKFMLYGDPSLPLPRAAPADETTQP
jgi:hypothetical protein